MLFDNSELQKLFYYVDVITAGVKENVPSPANAPDVESDSDTIDI